MVPIMAHNLWVEFGAKVTLLIYRFGSGVIWRHIILLMEDWRESMVYQI